LKEAGMYYDIIKEEFKEKGRTDSLEKHQLIELKKIKSSLVSGNISNTVGIESPIDYGPQTEEPESIIQKDLVKEIYYQGTDQLKSILSEDIYLHNIEAPCGKYGAVDMVYRSKGTSYPVEVKKDQGKHDLIGQINKYTLFHRLHLHLKHYKFVQPITICKSYLPYVLKELKQLQVLTLVYRRGETGLKINTI
jgi:hypothetical protein